MKVYTDVDGRSIANLNSPLFAPQLDQVEVAGVGPCGAPPETRTCTTAPNGSCRPGLGRLASGLSTALLLAAIIGCQTDYSAQMKIDQMRAELLAVEGRYAALRNDYEKVRTRLAAQGDPLSKSSAQPSALPLVYPPGEAPLDSMSAPDVWNSQPVAPELADPINPANSTNDPNSVLEDSATSGPAGTGASATPPLAPPNAVIQTLTLDPAHSHGINRDARPGDEEIRLLVQPLDAQGRLVVRPAEFEVTLLDYSRAENIQIGRWRFSPETVARFLRNRSTGAGIPLQIALQNHVLQNSQVMAEIKMQQPGGSPLVVREIVHVATPQNPVSNQAFNFQQLPAPKGAGGLADHSGVATGNPVPSYLPLQEQWEISTEAGNLEPLPEARPANYPTWSPERQ